MVPGRNQKYTSATFEELPAGRLRGTMTARIPEMSSAPQPVRAKHDWKLLYDAAVRETDRSKLPQRIATAQNAILNRIEESMRSPAFGEQCAMNDALRNLRRLEKSLPSRKRFSAFLW